MAKYRIAWLPGDGVGNDVMEAARIVLDQCHTLASGLFGVLERLFANVRATLHAHDPGGERDVLKSCLVFPLLHLRIGA